MRRSPTSSPAAHLVHSHLAAAAGPRSHAAGLGHGAPGEVLQRELPQVTEVPVPAQSGRVVLGAASVHVTATATRTPQSPLDSGFSVVILLRRRARGNTYRVPSLAL